MTFRLSFSASHLLFGLGIAWVWALSLILGPCPLSSYVRRLAGAPIMPLHCSCYDVTYLFVLLLLLGLWVKAPANMFLTFLSSFGLYRLAFLLGQPIPCLGLP